MIHARQLHHCDFSLNFRQLFNSFFLIDSQFSDEFFLFIFKRWVMQLIQNISTTIIGLIFGSALSHRMLKVSSNTGIKSNPKSWLLKLDNGADFHCYLCLASVALSVVIIHTPPVLHFRSAKGLLVLFGTFWYTFFIFGTVIVPIMQLSVV